jgi:hypothetical protein
MKALMIAVLLASGFESMGIALQAQGADSIGWRLSEDRFVGQSSSVAEASAGTTVGVTNVVGDQGA